jgi:hypothetical protein
MTTQLHNEISLPTYLNQLIHILHSQGENKHFAIAERPLHIMKYLTFLAFSAAVIDAHTIGQRLSVNGVEYPSLHGVRAPRLNDVSFLLIDCELYITNLTTRINISLYGAAETATSHPSTVPRMIFKSRHSHATT